MTKNRLTEVLSRIDTAATERRLPVVVFDLDSTIFSTSPRNMRILREFVEIHGREHDGLREAVARLTLDDMGWNVHESVAAAGFTDEAALKQLRRFWAKRFFTDDFVLFDRPTAGAAHFVGECHRRGAYCYYLTGRHVGGMDRGTARSLVDAGLPYYEGRTCLHLKPSFELGDKPFKDQALTQIRSLRGEVVATFENEPGNANLFLRAFPRGLHFLLQTVHSPEAEQPDAGLIPIPDFRLPR